MAKLLLLLLLQILGGSESGIRCRVILSTCHLIDLPFCHLAFHQVDFFLTCLFIALSSHKSVISPTYPFIKFIPLSSCYLNNLTFCQIAVSSTSSFVNQLKRPNLLELSLVTLNLSSQLLSSNLLSFLTNINPILCGLVN